MDVSPYATARALTMHEERRELKRKNDVPGDPKVEIVAQRRFEESVKGKEGISGGGSAACFGDVPSLLARGDKRARTFGGGSFVKEDDEIARKEAEMEAEYQRFEREIAALSGSTEVALSPMPTPPRVRGAKELVGRSDPREPLTPLRESALGAGLQDLKGVPTPQRVLHLDQMVLSLVTSPDRVGEREDLCSPRTAGRIHKLMQFPGSGWVGDVLLERNRHASALPSPVTPPYVIGINHKHITTFSKGSGFHFCPKEDDRRKEFVDPVKNEETGVLYVDYRGKKSTIFPDWIESEEELNRLITGATWISSKKSGKKGEKRVALATISKEAKTIWVMKHLDKRGLDVRTCYPLLYVKRLEEIEEIKLGSQSPLKKADLVAFLLNEVKLGILQERVRFRLEGGESFLSLKGVPGLPDVMGIYLIIGPGDLGLTEPL